MHSKIDQKLLSNSSEDLEAFIMFDPSAADEVLRSLNEQKIIVIKDFKEMGLCLIKAKCEKFEQLAENALISRLVAADDPVSLEDGQSSKIEESAVAQETPLCKKG